jgi:hypothetical protein
MYTCLNKTIIHPQYSCIYIHNTHTNTHTHIHTNTHVQIKVALGSTIQAVVGGPVGTGCNVGKDSDTAGAVIGGEGRVPRCIDDSVVELELTVNFLNLLLVLLMMMILLSCLSLLLLLLLLLLLVLL